MRELAALPLARAEFLLSSLTVFFRFSPRVSLSLLFSTSRISLLLLFVATCSILQSLFRACFLNAFACICAHPLPRSRARVLHAHTIMLDSIKSRLHSRPRPKSPLFVVFPVASRVCTRLPYIRAHAPTHLRYSAHVCDIHCRYICCRKAVVSKIAS